MSSQAKWSHFLGHPM